MAGEVDPHRLTEFFVTIEIHPAGMEENAVVGFEGILAEVLNADFDEVFLIRFYEEGEF